MSDTRHRNVTWRLPANETTGLLSLEQAQLAVLMDIRDELQTLNRLLSCPNFQDIPQKLERTARNTAGVKRALGERK